MPSTAVLTVLSLLIPKFITLLVPIKELTGYFYPETVKKRAVTQRVNLLLEELEDQ